MFYVCLDKNCKFYGNIIDTQYAFIYNHYRKKLKATLDEIAIENNICKNPHQERLPNLIHSICEASNRLISY